MIVVDSNVIAYLYLPGEHTAATEKLLERSPDGASPISMSNGVFSDAPSCAPGVEISLGVSASVLIFDVSRSALGKRKDLTLWFLTLWFVQGNLSTLRNARGLPAVECEAARWRVRCFVVMGQLWRQPWTRKPSI
jgi:hypothetical protein